jgi:D-psicose/D-tagatose/L-ribulose 3-epimerase
MRLGFSMLLWTPVLRREHLRWLPRLRELGYDGVEIPVVGADVLVLREVRRILDDLGMACTAVGFATEAADPISPDAKVRAAARQHLELLLDHAALLRADLLGGPLHSAYRGFTGSGPTPELVARSADVLRAVAGKAAALGIRLGVEFLNRFECFLVNTAAATDALVRQVAHPAVCTVYDTHHAHIEETDAGAALQACAGTLGHVQISECDRGVPGRGQVHWGATFATLERIGYDRWLVVESFSRQDPQFGSRLHVWREAAAAPDEVCREGIAFVRRMLDPGTRA